MTLKNALTTIRDRGPGVFINAAVNGCVAKFNKVALGRRHLVNRIHNYKMKLDLNDPGISRSLILFSTREVDHKVILERVLAPGMSVLDVGANIGYYALMELSLVGPKGKLIAVEPSPSNVELLKQNLELNGYNGVRVIEDAVSDKHEQRTFFIAKHSNLNTFHPEGISDRFFDGKEVQVTTYTVPELVGDEKIDLMRMDVEGHEVEIMRGMLPGIAAGSLRPMIIFETHLSRYTQDHAFEPILREMFQHGYFVRYMASSYERGTKLIQARGYKGSDPIPTDGMERVIFENISNDDAIDFICKVGGARTVLLDNVHRSGKLS